MNVDLYFRKKYTPCKPKISWYCHLFKPYLEATCISYLLKDQQISWTSFKNETLYSNRYFTTHISVFDSALHNLRYRCMGPTTQTNLDKLLNLQKRALRLLTLLHADLMRSRYSTNKIILPLKFQYCESFCTTMHDVSNNSLPANISKLLIYPTRMHSCNTRFYETGSFNIKYSRTYKSVEIFIF